MNTSANESYILDLDPCDAPTALCDTWSLDCMTVESFNQAMCEFAAEKRERDGGYAKLRGIFAWVDASGEECTLTFRIDVDQHMSEGRSLEIRFTRSARFYGTDRGAEYARANGNDPAEMIEVYNSAAVAAAA